MKKHKGSIEAYFTVEASLVMPVVIGSVIFVICFLLYWYNRCLMEQDLSVMAVHIPTMDTISSHKMKMSHSHAQKKNF